MASMARAMVDAAALALALASQESAPRLVLATAGQGASQARGGPNPGLVWVGLPMREPRVQFLIWKDTPHVAEH